MVGLSCRGVGKEGFFPGESSASNTLDDWMVTKRKWVAPSKGRGGRERSVRWLMGGGGRYEELVEERGVEGVLLSSCTPCQGGASTVFCNAS